MSLEDDFLYPLYLLLIGGGLTGLLIPLLLRRYEQSQRNIDREREDHKNELEIKSEIVKSISSSYSDTISMLYVLANYSNIDKNRKTTLDTEIFRTVLSTKSIITSLLKAYFKTSPIIEKWENFSHNTTRLWGIYDRILSGQPTSPDDIMKVKKYLKIDNIDWSKFEQGDIDVMRGLYIELVKTLLDYKTEIIDLVLAEKIKSIKVQTK